MSTTLLQRVDVADMAEPARAAWTQLNKLTGDASFVEVFAATPELLGFVMNDFYTKIFFAGRVEQRFKQLLRLKLSRIHGCLTCNKQNVPGSLEAGISEAQVAAIDDHSTGPFDEAETAVLDLAELVSMDNQTRTLDADLHQRLSRHFSPEEICELGLVAGVITGLAKLSFVFDVVEREDYCTFTPS